MFEVGIYRRSDKNNDKTRIFLIDNGIGFVLNNKDYNTAQFGNNWNSSFDIIDENYILSDKEIAELNKNSTEKSYLQEVQTYLDNLIDFSVKHNHIISSNENIIIRISSIDLVKKIDDSNFIIEYSGKEKVIHSPDFDKLKEKMIQREIL